MTENSNSDSNKIDRYKSLYEYLKHLTTLSTGSIVLLSTFLEKILKAKKWEFLIIAAIVALLFSVVCSTITYSLLIIDFPGRKSTEKEWEKIVGGLSLIGAWSGFLIGISSLAIFTIIIIGS